MSEYLYTEEIGVLAYCNSGRIKRRSSPNSPAKLNLEDPILSISGMAYSLALTGELLGSGV